MGSILAEAIGYTAQLAALGFLFALIFGIGIAVIASYAQNPWLRQALLSLPSLAVSIPAFWFGLLLIPFFFPPAIIPRVFRGGPQLHDLAGTDPGTAHQRHDRPGIYPQFERGH